MLLKSIRTMSQQTSV